ncbi:formin-like protein 2 isoform X2 [Capsella rubella]|uniref:formin-like protein 2 isoform X2 n=1 Tax=Capsella rubella TaxID=81985 RepID=UPI000CD4F589|nr:formin-like protein 2 isoform X2 [Capsella rubella]
MSLCKSSGKFSLVLLKIFFPWEMTMVTIWEERRVFGSRSKSLKDVMLSEEAPPPLDVNKKRSRGSKSSKRDSKSAKTKLSSGGVTEKIVSAFNLVRTENLNEETETNKCKSTVKRIRTMQKDVEDACSTAKDPRRKTLAKELEEEEITLRQSVEKLRSIEENRTSLVKHLKEALREQESELENLQSQIQVAQVQTEEAQNMQKRLNNEIPVNSNNGTSGQSAKVTPASIAAMAEMLTSSSNSSMIMHSVLSSFAAEATQTSGLTKSNSADTNAFAPPNPPPNPQYHMIPNPAASQQFIPYGFGNIPLMPPGQLPPPPGSMPPHMMNNQPNTAQQQSQQGPSFQPPSMMYFGPPHHS